MPEHLPPPGIEAVVSSGIPDMLVRVNDDTSFTHEGQAYFGGDEVRVPGPLAQSLVAQGHVTILMEEDDDAA